MPSAPSPAPIRCSPISPAIPIFSFSLPPSSLPFFAAPPFLLKKKAAPAPTPPPLFFRWFAAIFFPLFFSCPPYRLFFTHSKIWGFPQPRPLRQHRQGPRLAQSSGRASANARHGARSTNAIHPVSLLRRPHDPRRGLRARRNAESLVASTNTARVRQLMIASRNTNLFAALPRWSVTVSDAARLEGHSAIGDNNLAARRCAKRRSVPSFTAARMPCDSNRGCNSKPSTALKFP